MLVSITLKCSVSLSSRVIVISNTILLLTVTWQFLLLAMKKLLVNIMENGIYIRVGGERYIKGLQSTLQTDSP